MSESKPKAPRKPLMRRTNGKLIAGVAGGVANYFEMSPTLVRILFVLLSIIPGLAIPVYLIIWIVADEDGYQVAPVTSPRG